MSVITLKTRPSVLAAGTIVGLKEHDGPIGAEFDRFDEDDTFGMKTWEQSEGESQRLALNIALDKAGLRASDLGAVFAGDLINQCVPSCHGLSGFDAPFFGLFGACSTSAEAIMLASLLVDGGYIGACGAVTSSHNCAAERQFRSPLEYGGQRPPTAQWTVTGAGAFVIDRHAKPPYVAEVLPGRVIDRGVTDQSNMGAAMAPAAVDTLTRYFHETGSKPDDFAAVVTGDLGYEGSGILVDLMQAQGYDLSAVHADCGLTIYDRSRQDVHAGGSGCGCGAAVLAAHFLPKLSEKKDLLYLATGALMSPDSVKQGLSIPGVAHLVRFSAKETADSGKMQSEAAGFHENAPDSPAFRENAPDPPAFRENAPESAVFRENAPDSAAFRENAPESAAFRENAPESPALHENTRESAGTRENANESPVAEPSERS